MCVMVYVVYEKRERERERKKEKAGMRSLDFV